MNGFLFESLWQKCNSTLINDNRHFINIALGALALVDANLVKYDGFASPFTARERLKLNTKDETDNY